jgi:2-iminobutanoate/2-iminopropanoate deaminase
MKQVIRAGVPETGGPINIAVRHGNMVYISGLPPFTREFSEAIQRARREGLPLPKYPDIPFEQQVRLVMDSMKQIMTSVGSAMDNLLKVVVWLKDQSQQETFDRIYREYFSGPEAWPARTRMQAGRTPLDMGLEVDAIGYIPDAQTPGRTRKRAGAGRAVKSSAAKSRATRSGTGKSAGAKSPTRKSSDAKLPALLRRPAARRGPAPRKR